MKIGIDITKLHSLSKQRGIGFYAQNLIESLKKNPKLTVEVLEKESSNENLDVIHYPFFDLFRNTLPFLKKVPTVVTIHDVIPLIFPEHFPPGIKGSINNLLQRIALANVKAIITDSEASKVDIIKYLKIPEKKIFPINLAPAKDFRIISDQKILQNIKVKYKIPEVFVLYTGSVNWNKNLNYLAKACLDAEVDLVCIGAGFETKENLSHKELQSFKVFKENYANNPKIHVLGFVSIDELVAIMNLAKALMQVSFYEGFGLPILEAQSCGIPVIASKVSSIPEVAGDGALYVNPLNIQEITSAIKLIVRDRSAREKLIQKGERNVKKYSWEKTAQETIEVYRYAKTN